MNISRVLLSLPLRKQTVVGALAMATVLYIVYQFTFVAELTKSSNPQKDNVNAQHEHHQLQGEKPEHAQEINQNDHVKDVRFKKAGERIDGNIKGVAQGNKQNNGIDGEINGAWKKRIPQNEIQNLKRTSEKQKSVGTFRCEKSRKLIGAEKVNDNYCDCPEDGSDEPRTNACSNGKFICLKHVKSFPEIIPSGWVNDGVCDCCDGSDEWKMKRNGETLPLNLQRKIGRYLSPCPNLCPGAA